METHCSDTSIVACWIIEKANVCQESYAAEYCKRSCNHCLSGTTGKHHESIFVLWFCRKLVYGLTTNHSLGNLNFTLDAWWLVRKCCGSFLFQSEVKENHLFLARVFHSLRWPHSRAFFVLWLAHLIQGGCYDWPQPDYLLTKLFFPWIGNEKETSSEIKEIWTISFKTREKITHCFTLKYLWSEIYY